MKNRIAYLTICFVLPFLALGQVDRTKAPDPKPAREIKIGEYQSFTLKNGLQVFVVENHKLPRIQLSIQLKHDPILEGAKAGYVSIAGNLIGTGTTSRSKTQLDEEVDFIGASLNTSASSIFAASLTKHTAKLLELMTDVLYNPSFEQAELDKLKTQTISGIAAGKDDPGTIAANVRSILLYGKNHPYGEIATEKSIESITLDDCKNYYNTYFKPNNAYLVMVGDVTLKDAKKIAETHFAKWNSGELTSQKFTAPTPPATTYVALVDRPASVQSIINIAYPVNLKVGSEEVIKARVLNQILGGNFSARLNQNLREKHGYTYGSSSQLSSDDLVGRFTASASVRNEVTDSAIYEMMNELKRIVNDPVTQEELNAAKASIAGSFGRSLEQPQTIASFAVNTARYNLPKDYYSSYLKRLYAVSIGDIKSIAEKYIRPQQAYIEVVGKGSEIADKLKQFGEVKYYDINGDEYQPSVKKELPEGLTAEKVIDSYLEALGGKSTLNKIKSIKLVYKADAMGNELKMKIQKSLPDKALLEISSGETVFQKVVMNGKAVTITSMGQTIEADSREKERRIFEGPIFPELNLSDVKPWLISIDTIDGEEVYVVEISFPSGDRRLIYFNTQTNLKARQEDKIHTPQGEVQTVLKIEDYTETQGIRVPSKIIQKQGPISLTFELVEIEINPKLDNVIFK